MPAKDSTKEALDALIDTLQGHLDCPGFGAIVELGLAVLDHMAERYREHWEAELPTKGLVPLPWLAKRLDYSPTDTRRFVDQLDRQKIAVHELGTSGRKFIDMEEFTTKIKGGCF